MNQIEFTVIHCILICFVSIPFCNALTININLLSCIVYAKTKALRKNLFSSSLRVEFNLCTTLKTRFPDQLVNATIYFVITLNINIFPFQSTLSPSKCFGSPPWDGQLWILGINRVEVQFLSQVQFFKSCKSNVKLQIKQFKFKIYV